MKGPELKFAFANYFSQERGKLSGTDGFLIRIRGGWAGACFGSGAAAGPGWDAPTRSAQPEPR